MMMYNWRNKSSFLRALIKKNLKRRYKTFYDIKENCSSEEWEKKKANSACYKFW
jgi:CRISPR/Cas system endoribonuclease Cas6 (RAMP superfamily)